MKNITGFLLLLLPLCLIACSKSNTESNLPKGQSEYYVKYASDGLGSGYNVVYTDEKGERKSFAGLSGDSFERIIGPVSVGFEASFRIWVSNINDTKTRDARIEVKKDNNPFVVKVENIGKGPNGVSVSYTIE